jgi:hypothetical protein
MIHGKMIHSMRPLNSNIHRGCLLPNWGSAYVPIQLRCRQCCIHSNDVFEYSSPGRVQMSLSHVAALADIYKYAQTASVLLALLKGALLIQRLPLLARIATFVSAVAAALLDVATISLLLGLLAAFCFQLALGDRVEQRTLLVSIFGRSYKSPIVGLLSLNITPPKAIIVLIVSESERIQGVHVPRRTYRRLPPSNIRILHCIIAPCVSVTQLLVAAAYFLLLKGQGLFIFQV